MLETTAGEREEDVGIQITGSWSSAHGVDDLHDGPGQLFYWPIPWSFGGLQVSSWVPIGRRARVSSLQRGEELMKQFLDDHKWVLYAQWQRLNNRLQLRRDDRDGNKHFSFKQLYQLFFINISFPMLIMI